MIYSHAIKKNIDLMQYIILKNVLNLLWGTIFLNISLQVNTARLNHHPFYYLAAL